MPLPGFSYFGTFCPKGGEWTMVQECDILDLQVSFYTEKSGFVGNEHK